MAQFKKIFHQDLTKPRIIRHCEDVVFTGDNLSEKIGVYLYDNGEPYTGGGTVSGTVINSRGQTVPITTGEISGNLVTVTLEEAALAVPGIIGVYVKVTSGQQIATVLGAMFTAMPTETNQAIDPGTIIPSVTQLVTDIQTARNSIPPEYTELLAAVAPTFSASTAYTSGAYVWQGGNLYRFTADHAAGSWTGTDAVQVSLAGDLGQQVSDLRSAVNYLHDANNKAAPAVLENTSANYNAWTAQTATYFSNRIIPKGSFISSVDLRANSLGTIVFINNDNKVVYTVQTTSYNFNNVLNHKIGYWAEEDVRIGFAGFKIRYKALNATDDTTLATDGVYESSNAAPVVGDVLTITKTTSTTFFRFLAQWHYTEYRKHGVNSIEKGWLPKGLQVYPNMLRYTDIDSDIGFIGRWYTQTVNGHDCHVTNNCGSEFYFKTSGATTVTIEWQAMTQTNAYYVYIIDGNTPVRALITSTTIALPDSGTHYIRIITDGITEEIGKWANGTGFAFSGVTVNQGSVSGVMPKNPQIMFFGDSITEGIRALGIDNTDMGNTNSATGAFPWYCCKKLNAIPFRVGYGATGINKTGSFNTAINALEYLYNGTPVDKYYPDAIVINYGTNDDGNTDFNNGYIAYLNAMHLMYPGVKVYVMIPFSQHLASRITTVASGFDWVELIETANWDGITYADGIHPLAAGAEVAGNYLADALIADIYD